MNINNQKGFSLIELILVVVIIGIIAAIAIPSLSKATAAAENGSAVSTLKAISVAQATIVSQKGRYGRFDEVNKFQDDKLGTVTANILARGKFQYEMIPSNPTDAELKNTYLIKASRTIGAVETPYVLRMDHTAIIDPIFP